MLSIIIINYNSQSLTLDAIRSIRQMTDGVEYELIVVDNGSSEGTEQLQQVEGIQLLELGENIGFGRGNNRGAEVSQGDYLLFLNSDILLRNNAIFEQVQYLDKHPEVVAVGGQLFDAEGQACHSYRKRLPGPLDDLCPKWNNDRTPGVQPLSVGYIIGADLMVRSEVFRAVGGFDADFFLYYEDAELCHRLSEHGELHIIAQAEYTHLESRSQSSQLSKQRFIMRSRRLYYSKVKPQYQWWLSNMLVTLRACAHIAIDTLLHRADAVAYWRLTLSETYHLTINN